MKNHVQTKQITYEKNVNAINKKVLCYRKKKNHKKNKPLFHPFKSTAPYLSSIKVHFSGSDKKWSSPSCSSSSLACGGRMFSMWSMEWDTIQSTREKSAEKWKKIDVTKYPLFYSFIDITTVHYTDYIK